MYTFILGLSFSQTNAEILSSLQSSFLNSFVGYAFLYCHVRHISSYKFGVPIKVLDRICKRKRTTYLAFWLELYGHH